MKVFVYRENASMLVAFDPSEPSYTVPCRRAMLTYRTGFCTIVQPLGAPTFFVVGMFGPQFSREQITEILTEIADAGVHSDERVVLVHRAPPERETVDYIPA